MIRRLRLQLKFTRFGATRATAESESLAWLRDFRRVPALTRRVANFSRGLHRDQTGSISIVSLFAMLLLTMLLGMVMNSGRQVDQKIKMQNAADAATYSGGVVLARSMNTLAFTNHLLSDVFALTAFLREARDRHVADYPDEILDAWGRIAPILSSSEFPKFAALGQAIAQKVPRERDVVYSYQRWAAAASDSFLPVIEAILAEERIPRFQRDLVDTAPQLIQFAARDVARRHGETWPRPADLHAVVWRTMVDPVGGGREGDRRTLPVVDPLLDNEPNQQQYFETALTQRNRLAYCYLRDWNNEMMQVFDTQAKMSQFGNLWRVFTCGQLRRLLEEEYPDTNLPFVIRDALRDIHNVNAHLERDFMFVGTVYRKKPENYMPGVFRNTVAADNEAYAQLMLFVPRRRLVWWNNNRHSPVGEAVDKGGVPGHVTELPRPPGDDPEPPGGGQSGEWYVTRQDYVRRWDEINERWVYVLASDRHSETWDLLNQNWTVQLVPGTTLHLAEILSRAPSGSSGQDKFHPPNVGTLDEEQMFWLSNH